MCGRTHLQHILSQGAVLQQRRPSHLVKPNTVNGHKEQEGKGQILYMSILSSCRPKEAGVTLSHLNLSSNDTTLDLNSRDINQTDRRPRALLSEIIP